MPQYEKLTTLYLIEENVQEYNPASGVMTPLTSPASVIGRVRVGGASTYEFAASPIAGASPIASWYFEYATPYAGDIEWQFEFTKGGKKSLTEKQRFTVVESLPDV